MNEKRDVAEFRIYGSAESTFRTLATPEEIKRDLSEREYRSLVGLPQSTTRHGSSSAPKTIGILALAVAIGVAVGVTLALIE